MISRLPPLVGNEEVVAHMNTVLNKINELVDRVNQLNGDPLTLQEYNNLADAIQRIQQKVGLDES